MSEICKAHGNSESGISYKMILEYLTETEKLAVFRVTLININSGNREGELFINFNLQDSSSDLHSRLDPGTYAAGVLYCASKKVVIEAVKCIAGGSENTKDLLECMKAKGEKLSIAMALCFIKGFWADS